MSSSWLPWPRGTMSKLASDDAAAEKRRQEEALHRKRLAAILRYIASMHSALRSADGSSTHSFVRSVQTLSNPSDFFQHERSDDEFVQEDGTGGGVLFSTNDFRKLIAAEAMDGGSSSLFSSPPFSFYASSTSPTAAKQFSSSDASSGKKRSFANLYGRGSSAQTSSTARTSQTSVQRGQGLWLRITRLGPNAVIEQPEAPPIVDKYLKSWLDESAPRDCATVTDLLTIHNLERAPGIPSTVYSVRNQRIIKGFLKRYKRYLRMKLYQQTLEPIYNRLFEWIQQQNENNEELVWGLGHAKLRTSDGQLINGPLLEVLVEVELAPDGGLLVKPRQHTGVALNREVVAALIANDASAQHSALSQLHRAVGELESTQLAPGQPTTYVPLLKRIAMEISSGGAFQASSVNATLSPSKKNNLKLSFSSLIVSEAWCLFSRSKPSSVWARDANTLADHIALPERCGEVLPMAAWSLTHGPTMLETFLMQQSKEHSAGMKHQIGEENDGIRGWLARNFLSKNPPGDEPQTQKNEDEKNLIFPLATSDSQLRIADLLLRQNYPAVLAEGPPGTGKTHSIANVVSAYLCQGKRVLVTSKNANALNVLRGRLPKSIQELCVDVTMSELQGMRQLQQTVERLAIRVSAASTDVESEKCRLLQRSIDDLEAQLKEIDKSLTSQSERLRHLLHQSNGVKLMEESSFLIRTAPWLMKTLPDLRLEDLEVFSDGLRSLKLDKSNAILTVEGFESSPSKALVSMASAKSGSALSSLAHATRNAVAALPVVGAMMDAQLQRLSEDLDKIKIHGKAPSTEGDWKTVADALNYALAVQAFQDNIWIPMVKGKGWPEKSFDQQNHIRDMSSLLEKALEVKRIQMSLEAEAEIEMISKCREMDAYRSRLSTQIQHHSEELADAAVVTELSRSFSPDAQSALIRFSQIAGAAKFSKSAKPSKMTQRQRRRRQEYLEAFDRCVRQIPCWIMTSSQISQYLPAETLFDLVVIDESSQSDVTVLPGMMRGKQWLIVGDGKQVSPTEAFVSDDDIDSLKAALPSYCPFADALLPGRSFFDMCAQAFPRGRVVLSEHFRCAPEIIGFSNSQFYDGRLVPLRLPTKCERMTPSLIDVKLPNGVKSGKVNEQEANEIVNLARETMELADDGGSRPKTIGIISLLGDDQSRLIRGRLLDAVGPEKMARHEVLIGDPPTFQGAERDVIFLSMVCSPGSAPTQNQQFHFQRANVAMSRARDRCVLVRSLDLKDIPSLDDSKVAIIEFFMQASQALSEDEPNRKHPGRQKAGKKRFGSSLLKFLLNNRGYQLVEMGVVWKDAVCVEHQESDTRAALMIDCEESSPHEWLAGFAQQKAIERVGWKCLRIDALSLVVDFSTVLKKVVMFLASVGIPDPELETKILEGDDFSANDVDFRADEKNKKPMDPEVIEIDDDDDEGDDAEVMSDLDRKPAARLSSTVQPDTAQSSFDFDRDDGVDPSKFGEVVDLNFLLRRKSSDNSDEIEEEDDEMDDGVRTGEKEKNQTFDSPQKRIVQRRSNGNMSSSSERMGRLVDRVDLGRSSVAKKPSSVQRIEGNTPRCLDEAENPSDEGEGIDTKESPMECNSASSSNSSKRRKRRRLDKYSRDGRWHPGSVPMESVDHDDEWYDTDSDLPKEKLDRGQDDESWKDGEDDEEGVSNSDEDNVGDGEVTMEVEQDHSMEEEDNDKVDDVSVEDNQE